MSKDTHKKIALVTISLAGGGAERSTALLSRMLETRGFDVTIITLNNEVDYTYGGKIYAVGAHKKSRDTFWSRCKRFKKLRGFIEAEGFDIIIDNRNRSNAYKEQFYLGYIYKNQKIVYVARSFKLESYFPVGSSVAQKMIDRAAGVVGVSQAISQEIEQVFNTEKAYTIYNPVDEVTLSRALTKSPYFIFTGRLVDEVKNVSLLLHAFAKANKQQFQLHIYGDGIDKEKLQALSHSLGLEEWVFFFPFDAQISEKVAAARALILTSHYEGFPRAIIEALAVGTPVISVDCKSGPNEVIKNEYNGLLVKNYDETALATAIERFVYDDELLKTCTLNARESISHLGLDIIGDTWEDYLQTL